MLLLDRQFDHTTRPVHSAVLDGSARRSIEAFVLAEARLLDERRFHEWLALWTADGRYWVPRHHGQDNPFEQISMFFEDAVLRETRVRRLLNPRNWSQQPPTRSIRMTGPMQVDGIDAAGRVIVRSTLCYTEHRLVQRQLAAEVFHKLEAQADGSWRLHLKRVNLVNCDDLFSALEVFL